MKTVPPIFIQPLRLLKNSTTITLIAARFFVVILFFLPAKPLSAQRDLIIKKDSTEIRCKVLADTSSNYVYAFIDSTKAVVKSNILKSAVDTVLYNKFNSDISEQALFKNASSKEEVEESSVKPYQFSFAIGLNVGNVLEFNSSNGPDKKSLSLTAAFDLGLNYAKEGKPFAMTNELHWTFAIQKTAIAAIAHVQRTTDDLTTLHDFSLAMNKSNKWNFNLIAKTATSVFTIYNGNFFKDYNNQGKIQAFLSPYQVTLSPGIKFQPDDYFRLSISPYSISLYGLTSQQIANTGFYTETFDANNNYDRFAFKQLGAEINLWYDKKVGKWLTMQYRLGISSDYFSRIAKNGLMDGLFITKLKIIKNVSLSHRAILRGDIGSSPFKPYYSQTILLSYSKSF